MKELKFRAWSKENNRYCDFVTLDESGRWIGWIKSSGIYLTTIDINLEQYTGLNDKNGKEIYVGDIVSVRNKNRKNEHDIGVVEFEKAAFRCPFLLGKYHSGQVEVIGNAHENDNLLEEEEMNREELKDTIKKAYKQGYQEGFNYACDVIAPALTDATTKIVAKLKDRVKDIEVEVIDEHEVNNGEKD